MIGILLLLLPLSFSSRSQSAAATPSSGGAPRLSSSQAPTTPVTPAASAVSPTSVAPTTPGTCCPVKMADGFCECKHKEVIRLLTAGQKGSNSQKNADNFLVLCCICRPECLFNHLLLVRSCGSDPGGPSFSRKPRLPPAHPAQ